METKEYRNAHDKKSWGEGPWQNEPDKIQWMDNRTKLPCLIVRNCFGALCGYVGVVQTHPYYGLYIDEVELEVHGGITFTDECRPGGHENVGVCHVPAENESDQVWWLGFDCGHYNDISPAIEAIQRQMGLAPFQEAVYRNVEYVKREIESLAWQLYQIGTPAQYEGQTNDESPEAAMLPEKSDVKEKEEVPRIG